MKVRLPNFPGDVEGGHELGRVMRGILKEIEFAFLKIRIDDQIIIGGGTPILKHLSTTATWNPGNLVAGAQTSVATTLTGAALGDEVTCSFSLDLQLLQLTSYVSSANTITSILQNGTAGAIDLASGTLRVSVWQH